MPCSVFRADSHSYWIITGKDSRGELYGVFHLLEQIAQQNPFTDDTESPSAPIRWVNQWDNFDGTIERGYAGRSIFFADGHVRQDLTRVSEYGRLLASIGLNGCTVNNVNSDLRTLDPTMLHELARIADAFRPWGVRMSLSIDLSSPQVVGGLATFDPVDPQVAAWWQQKVDEIYKLIPDFGGFVIKADSEGRVGPSKYGRTPAQAANTVARALKPHGGVVLYRGFVYNNHLDWNDLKADRARAGYDNFHALDGTFEPNVVIQIKHGPIDFQVREPVSPLFAALQHTSQAIELQITQEYTGQQRHMVFLVPMWKTALDTDLRAQDRSTPVKEIVEGKSFHQPLGGFVGVANVGLDDNWMHHPMAMANLYGFGKLAWNPNLTTDQIIDAWTRLTWGNNPKVVSTINDLQRNSWHVYEQYTGNLGIGTLTNILSYHYGPGIESAERNGWGQWFRGDPQGIGMDRTVATGTGYIGQYPPELAKVYENVNTCPDDLLLFMHHVPYTHVLHDGKTVVQYVYDAHYEGAATAQTYAPRWQTLKGLIDDERYNKTLKLFTYQAGHAIVWRDAVTKWFQKESGIRGQARPRRQLPQPHRSRKYDRRRLHPRRRQTLGDRLQQQSRGLQPTRRLHPHHNPQQTRWHLLDRRPVLRLLVRQIPLHPRPQPSTYRRMDRRRHSPPRTRRKRAQRRHQHPHHLPQHHPQTRRHLDHPRHARQHRTRPRRLRRDHKVMLSNSPKYSKYYEDHHRQTNHLLTRP